MLARIIEPTSKLDSLRVLAEVGGRGAVVSDVKRRLPGYATEAGAHAGCGLRSPRRAGPGDAGPVRRDGAP